MIKNLTIITIQLHLSEGMRGINPLSQKPWPAVKCCECMLQVENLWFPKAVETEDCKSEAIKENMRHYFLSCESKFVLKHEIWANRTVAHPSLCYNI